MKFDQPKKTQDGRYYLKVSNDDGSRVLVQLNNVNIANKFSDEEQVTLGLNEINQGKVKTIDDVCVSQAEESSQEWFGKVLSPATLKSAYTGLSGKDSINVSKATVKGKVVTNIFDHEKNVMAHDDLGENVACDVILEFSGIWFMKKTYGPIWRLAQVKVRSPPKKKQPVYPNNYMFADEDVEDESEQETEDDSDFI